MHRPKAFCKHLGDQIDQGTVLTCRGLKPIPVYSCDLHGRCTVTPDREGTRFCYRCPDREPPGLFIPRIPLPLLSLGEGI